jgi:Tfp pilus assembly protein PilF
LEALDTAVRLDPGFQPTYVYRGAMFASMNDYQRARAEYRQALALKPGDEGALKGLAFVEQRLAGR